ncbi:hypothetical protein PSE10A_46410 [Pseudomonas amygdali pv. eriobotryae]|uniref:Uncharacterized protein n=2 Tax=Pseudomonas amygdali TaxID=47877 RepID=A0A9P3AH39_PSEA0|nr:hypothetical protein PSE10A_46410 [Pseudomonas amygdali pv. eriobotryae]
MSDETIEFYEKITPKPYCGRGCYQTIEELKSEHGKRIKSGIVEFQSGAIKKGHTYSRLTIEHYLLGDRQPYYFFENDKGGFFAKMYNSVSPFALIIIFFGFVELLSRKPKINKPEEKKPV